MHTTSHRNTHRQPIYEFEKKIILRLDRTENSFSWQMSGHQMREREHTQNSRETKKQNETKPISVRKRRRQILYGLTAAIKLNLHMSRFIYLNIRCFENICFPYDNKRKMMPAFRFCPAKTRTNYNSADSNSALHVNFAKIFIMNQ